MWWVLRSLGGMEAQRSTIFASFHKNTIQPWEGFPREILQICLPGTPTWINPALSHLFSELLVLGALNTASDSYCLLEHLQLYWWWRRIRSPVPRWGSLGFSPHKGLEDQVREKNLKRFSKAPENKIRRWTGQPYRKVYLKLHLLLLLKPNPHPPWALNFGLPWGKWLLAKQKCGYPEGLNSSLRHVVEVFLRATPWCVWNRVGSNYRQFRLSKHF